MRSFQILLLVLSMITVMNAQQPTSSNSIAMTATSTSQSIMGTASPSTTNEANSSNVTTTTNASAHGSMVTPSASLSSSPSASNTARPPQFAPLPDDTVGKNGRLRVSSMAIGWNPPNSYLLILCLVFIISF
ncbi:hypothetical protein BC941DRAFT_439851 [Chlamydoabsidia padenii]|nr:hypothetical protein BC941DRAFT_439851 [Chlamydoabsidia padenii]